MFHREWLRLRVDQREKRNQDRLQKERYGPRGVAAKHLADIEAVRSTTDTRPRSEPDTLRTNLRAFDVRRAGPPGRKNSGPALRPQTRPVAASPYVVNLDFTAQNAGERHAGSENLSPALAIGSINEEPLGAHTS